jgi:ElaB/YqjD/DUF883 family membrane-anchored ribosome-binding protein
MNFAAPAAKLRRQEIARLTDALTPRLEALRSMTTQGFRTVIAAMLERFGHAIEHNRLIDIQQGDLALGSGKNLASFVYLRFLLRICLIHGAYARRARFIVEWVLPPDRSAAMDDQPIREIDKTRDAVRRASAEVADAVTAQTAAVATRVIDQATTMVRAVGETINEAATMARAAGEQAWSAASDAAATAQDLTRQAREQASAAGNVLSEQGARASEYVTRNVTQYPLTAVLVAGAIGYLTAYLIHASWSASDGVKAPAIIKR